VVRIDEIDIDEELVRDLLRSQHPDLADLRLRSVDGGWDNRMWRLGEDLAVRLPRTERAPELLAKEWRWLPEVVGRLPLPASRPVRTGEPSARFPKPWNVMTWVPGEPADRAVISRPEHAADRLAAFLSALHRPAPADAPTNPYRGDAPRERVPWDEERIRELADPAIGPDTLAAMRTVWDAGRAAPEWDGPPVWLHSDLHPANVVVVDGTLAGVIDFGDLCAGDPAWDLAAAWMLLPDGAAARFFAAYANPHVTVDRAMIRRARAWAVSRAIVLMEIGRAGERGLPGGKVTWLPAGRATLRRALAWNEADAPVS
jgi:aminoglycoside phosphotransferase (APT) family kinase protein